MYKRCATCGTLFFTNRSKQEYCSRRCFKINYLKKKKTDEPPEFICSHCGNSVKLNFNPKKDKEVWEKFVCPKCGLKKEKEELIN